MLKWDKRKLTASFICNDLLKIILRNTQTLLKIKYLTKYYSYPEKSFLSCCKRKRSPPLGETMEDKALGLTHVFVFLVVCHLKIGTTVSYCIFL